MKKIIIFLCLSSSITLSAQVAGYMGKRFTVGYSNLFSPSFGKVYTFNLSSDDRVNSLNASQVLDFNYIIHYRKALCFSFSYIGSKISNKIVENDYSHNYVFTDAKNNARSSSLGFSLGVKLFKRSFLAPLGPYVRWDALLLINSIKYKPYTYNSVHYNYANNTSTTETKNIGSGELKSTAFGLAFGFGRQRIVKDKILIDIGIRGAIALNINDDFIKTNSNYDNSLYLLAFNKIFFQQFINLRLGIGFLAF